ncbi:MAG: GFA family protein [Pseudooceanicola sp.]
MSLRISGHPLAVAYCHCIDCRRWTGAPVAAFAAVTPDAVRSVPDLGVGSSVSPGVRRWNCADCGSPLACTFDYLPDQVYVPVGIIDQAAELAPQTHSYEDARLPWLHIQDDLPRADGSGRAMLNGV